jgi:hypothetical protein
MTLYNKTSIKSVEIVDRKDETDYIRYSIGREDTELAEIEQDRFYIFLEFINGDSDTVMTNGDVAYFTTEQEARSHLHKILI